MEEEIEVKYPSELINSMESFPEKEVIPCSVLFEGKEIGGLFIVCPSQDMEYFGIEQSSHPEPPLKFRILNFKEEVFAIEIWMQFGQHPEKYLKMHLNPYDAHVRRFLGLGSITNMISFHFYNTGSHEFATAITHLNDEEAGWFDRTYKLSTGLTPNSHGYQILADHLHHQVSDTDRIFKYHDAGRTDFFINDGDRQITFPKVQK